MATNVDAAFSQISTQLATIQANQAASKQAQDRLIADLEKFISQNSGTLTPGQQATLQNILSIAQGVSDGLVAETVAATAEDQKVNPPATPAA